MTPQVWAGMAAIIYLTGLAVLVGVRTWRHRRATGHSGFAGIRGRDGWARAAGLSFVAAVLLGAAALVLAAAGVVPVLGPPRLMVVLGPLGLAVTAGGLGLAWAAQSAMGGSWRIGVDPTEVTALVTDGIFGHVRNPIFTAMIAAQAGTVLMAPSWPSLVGIAALVAAIQLQVRRVEEPYLQAVHGFAYRAYCARAGRFLPGIGRRRPPQRATDGPAAGG
jgi:protein-S-isoprenylcysteine O-methyltransferase Ste14